MEFESPRDRRCKSKPIALPAHATDSEFCEALSHGRECVFTHATPATVDIIEVQDAGACKAYQISR